MKKILLIFLLLLLTGCQDYVEINELALVTGIVVDYKDNVFEVTAQIVKTEKESTVETYTTTADTIEEALAKITTLCDKELFLPHLKILIITNNVIENNINYSDMFLRTVKSKMNFYLYYIDSDIAHNVLNLYKDKDGSALYVDRMMKFNEKIFTSSTPLDFTEATQDSLEYGINPIYPRLSIIENNGKKLIYLDTLVSYNKDLEKTILTENESIFYNIITNKTKRATISIPCGESKYSLDFRKVGTKFKFKDGVFSIDVKITAKLESYKCNYDLNKPETSTKIGNIASKYVIDSINKLVNRSKKNNNDFIGIGNYIYKHDTKYFDFKNNNWDNNLKNVSVKVTSKVSIISTGETRKGVSGNYAKNK